MHKQRHFILIMALLTASATSALAQTVAPLAGRTSSGTTSTISIPDFSGIWAHLALPGFDPPLSGPGPVTNRSRRNGRSSFNEFVGDYTNPILKPAAAEVVRKHGEISLSGVPYPTPSNQCWPNGVPYVQMLQQPHQITILYTNDHEVRRVRLNQPKPLLHRATMVQHSIIQDREVYSTGYGPVLRHWSRRGGGSTGWLFGVGHRYRRSRL